MGLWNVGAVGGRGEKGVNQLGLLPNGDSVLNLYSCRSDKRIVVTGARKSQRGLCSADTA